MHIGVIATVKQGFEHFVHRELSFLEQRGAHISVYPTKFRKGLYGPRDTWTVHRWNLFSVAIAQLLSFCANPGQYVRLLKEAIQYRALVDFALAITFARRMHDADLIYATFGDHKLFVGYFCKRLLGKPLMCTIHAYELYENPNEKLFKHALQHCDQITTVTEYNRGQLTGRFGVDPRNIEVIRLAVDLQEYQPRDKFVVLIVGYFTEKKGHRVLLEAIKKIDNPDIEVWVVGTGVDSPRSVDVPGIAKELGIESQVALFGGLSGAALKAVYHACDVFCLPSHFDDNGIAEGFPTVIIEAMACGKPVVTTRHVEIPVIVEQILVDERDVDGLAEGLLQAYHSASLREEMGLRNRELALQHFSSRNVERTNAIMRSLCGEPPETQQPGKITETGAEQHETCNTPV